jgi:TRAP-type C4-dicarboxylate transport system substrate-binding protein
MKKSIFRLQAVAFAVALAAALVPGRAQAVDQISAVHAFPTFLVYTKTFLAFVEDLNARGEGVVEITVRGGPEAIGMFEQPAAVRDGVVDMVHTPGSFYGASVPEIDAMVASHRSPMEVRANGGAALMDQAHRNRFNTTHLGWIDSGVHFHIYMVNEPTFNDNGVLDLTDVKLRDNPIYHAFFEALNATTSSMPSTEVFSALERGVVEATAWTAIGILDLKWDNFLNYRVDPSFYTTDIGIIMNLDSWNALSDESRRIVQETVIDWEQKSYDARQLDIVADAAALQEGGMQFVSMSEDGGVAYQTLADDAAWNRMLTRLEEMGSTELYEGLRAAYGGM